MGPELLKKCSPNLPKTREQPKPGLSAYYFSDWITAYSEVTICLTTRNWLTPSGEINTRKSACVHESIAWTLDLGALRIVGCPLRRTFPNPPSIHLSEKPTSKWKVPNWQSVNASAFSGLILLTGLKQLIWGLGKRNFQSAVLPDSHSWRLALNQ